jgi:hypothetical protein
VAFGFGFVVVALGAALFYKGYKGWSWNQFYQHIFKGTAVPKTG